MKTPFQAIKSLTARRKSNPKNHNNKKPEEETRTPHLQHNHHQQQQQQQHLDDRTTANKTTVDLLQTTLSPSPSLTSSERSTASSSTSSPREEAEEEPLSGCSESINQMATTSSSTTAISNNTSTEKKSWFDMTYDEHWSRASLDMVARALELSDKDLPALLDLKERLQDWRDHPLNDPLQVALFYQDSRTLSDAEQKFRDMVTWRRQRGMDENTYHPPALVQRYHPSCFLEGTDKDGDPIWLDRTGAADPWAICQKYGTDGMQQYVLWVREQGLRGHSFARCHYEAQYGRPPARVTFIIDMEGLGMRHLEGGLIDPLEEGITMLQNYYGVSLAKRILIIRAPFVFRIVWSIAQHFCSESLKKKIIFCNAKTTQATLDKYIARHVLPSCICKEEGKGQPAAGFSQDLRGGPMPEHLLKAKDDDLNVEKDHDVLELKTQGSSETVLSSCDSSTTSSAGGAGVGGGVGRKDGAWMHQLPQEIRSSKSGALSIRTTSLLKGCFDPSDTTVEAIQLWN